MCYLVDTNVFLHAIGNEIFTVANLCKESKQEITITETKGIRTGILFKNRR